MKIKSMKLQNFRSYKSETVIELGDLTAFVGKNDIGKSSVLEALDIFFNDSKGSIKIDKDDINKAAYNADDKEIIISLIFEELPSKVVIDASNETTLENEYLINTNGQLEIIKRYPNAGTAKTYIRAYHPTNPDCSGLMLKKDTDLRKIIEKNEIPCSDKTRNAVMRTAIWNFYKDDLQLNEIEIDVSKGDTKSIWERV